MQTDTHVFRAVELMIDDQETEALEEIRKVEPEEQARGRGILNMILGDLDLMDISEDVWAY